MFVFKKKKFYVTFQVFPIDNPSNSKCGNRHCVKSVRIRSYSGPHFSAFGLNMERYGVSPLDIFSSLNYEMF